MAYEKKTVASFLNSPFSIVIGSYPCCHWIKFRIFYGSSPHIKIPSPSFDGSFDG